ncbi:pyroglutamyl-peptidase I [Bifidobacterium phasiani]|uniref:Pyroglutamyl-peptidase I n=1 Tax=Bifidobacterium phasiani TaxID=2834431 RepID=A0ABS6WAX5_9BIFI|nr:pyroglutamyl-peptidase I [Bifidobacterium phasiani]MBW3083651.1 pyroglutamyl-peptidase I [Bifidobacterium phasiani]
MQQFSVVISGFDHYDGVDVNPSCEVPRALAERGVAGSGGADDPLADVAVDIHAVGLPVSFSKSWPALLEAIEAARPDVVIATGLKHSARGIALERCATNLMDAREPDADNDQPRRAPIDPDGPAAYWTRLPLRAILKDFTKEDIPATLSSDAGTYVCNTLFYNLMHWTADQDRVLSGFVSFPQVTRSPHSQCGLTLDQQIAACRNVVRETVRYHLRPSSEEILLA